MTDLVDQLTSGPAWLTVAIVVLIVIVLTMMVVGLLQGRELHFWPPRIGPRPERQPPDRAPPATPEPASAASDREDAEETRPGPVPERSAWRRQAVVDHDRLFGVEGVIDDIVETVLTATPPPIVSLFGDGGIGKTTLAYEVASLCARSDRFSRVAWISAKSDIAVDRRAGSAVTGGGLAASSTTPTGDAIRVLAGQLGARLGPGRALWQQELSAYIANLPEDERVLTVIDNIESAGVGQDAIAYVRELGLGSPHQIIATTRWSLRSRSSQVREFHIRPLSDDDALALMVHLGRQDRDLSEADADTLKPVLAVTEGNPFLIKLVINHLLLSHRPLGLVLEELTTLGSELGGLAHQVREHLYVRSLLELERRHGADQSQALMGAFCTRRQGETFSYGELEELVGDESDGRFGELLEGACQLSLVTTSSMNERYSIHSLLHEFTCRLG